MIFGRTYSKTIIWQNDVTSAPPADPSGPRAVVAVIQPQQPKPFRGQTLVGAATADIYFSGPCIATPQPARAGKSTSVVITPSGPRFGEMPPAPFIITHPSATVAGPLIVYRQAQDGATPDVSGPMSMTLIVTRPRPVPVVPSVMTLANPQVQAVMVARPAVFTRPIVKAHRARVWITHPFVEPPPVEPAEFVFLTGPLTLTIDEIRRTLTLDTLDHGLSLDDTRTTMEIDP